MWGGMGRARRIPGDCRLRLFIGGRKRETGVIVEVGVGGGNTGARCCCAAAGGGAEGDTMVRPPHLLQRYFSLDADLGSSERLPRRPLRRGWNLYFGYCC